jgi:hypothetical protein
MVYWIDHNGEKLGPMTAADVLRRASGETAGSDNLPRETQRIMIRKAG